MPADAVEIAVRWRDSARFTACDPRAADLLHRHRQRQRERRTADRAGSAG
ncbi:hypothetical protein [Micromonospora sp. NPDC092111]